MKPLFTIGHSTRSLEDFISLLQDSQIRTVADIRSVPSSRKYPWFDGGALSEALSHHQISYLHISALGGHRPKNKAIDPDANAFWDNQSFHNYADYAMTQDFRAGLDELIAIGQRSVTAMMCSEAVWWRCHRRIVTDYLIAEGIEVRHILSPTKVSTAEMTSAAQPAGYDICYPRKSA
jgi:uncharacterized protein (DUF488 family)